MLLRCVLFEHFGVNLMLCYAEPHKSIAHAKRAGRLRSIAMR
jgi:hypothetical protein